MSFFNDYLNEQLKDPEFRKHWEESAPEYEIARQLILIRKKRGLTQTELARRVRTKQSVISRIERGDQNLSMRTLTNIARAMNARVKVSIELDDEEDLVKN